MSPLPQGPWLKSAAAHDIGPVERVCTPTRTHLVSLGCIVLFSTVAIEAGPCLYFNAFAAFAGSPMLGCTLLLVGLVIPVLAVAIFTAEDPGRGERLLLGQRGVALWSPDECHVVLWDDLGTVWRPVEDPAEDLPLSVVLERSDGTQLAITARFTDHHPVALRVLEELERRTGTKDSSPPQRGPASHAITPAERGVIEPGETP
jgi:hypothetical protein